MRTYLTSQLIPIPTLPNPHKMTSIKMPLKIYKISKNHTYIFSLFSTYLTFKYKIIRLNS